MPKLPKKTELIGVMSLLYMIELVLWSAYVKGARQVSLIILGKPETAKTEAPAKYIGNKGVIPIRRFSARGIIEMLLDGVIDPTNPAIFIIADLDALFKQKQVTVYKLVHFLNAIMWDGLDPEATYLIKYKELKKFRGFKAGFIAGVTDEGFFTKYKHVKANLKEGGFLSRTIVFSIDYSASQVEKILTQIFDGKHSKKFIKHIHLDFPDKKLEVYLPKEQRERLKALTRDIAEQLGARGFRIGEHLMALAKASVLRDHRKFRAVLKEDVDLIEHLSYWMNFDQNKLRDYKP
jgi:hypothetical protein